MRDAVVLWATGLGITLLVGGGQAPQLAAAELTPIGAQISAARYAGRDAVRLIANDGRRGAAMALLKGGPFQDGTIEADVAGLRSPLAEPDDRGFIGLAFRIQPGGDQYEYVYLRPENARADDQVRRNHSVQYAAHPDFPWPRLRKESPERYESYTDLAPGVWASMRVDVSQDRMRLFVNGSAQPVLIVNDLKFGASRAGGVGLWIGPGTEGFFANVRVTAR